MSDTAAQSPAPLRALAYLYARAFVNRLRAQARRLSSPRYLAAVALGVLYLWWALYRNVQVGHASLDAVIQSNTMLVIGSALLLVYCARWWLFGSERSALAFTPAEVQFLFPAPVSRRGLIHAKLLRMQLAVLVNTVIFSILLRGQAHHLASWERGLALWVVFSTMALHRLGAAIVRASALEHGPAGQRRGVIPLVVFSALLGAVAYGIITQLPLLRAATASGARAFLVALATTLDAPVPAAALWPVRMVLTPLVRVGVSSFGATLAGALVVLLAHYLWVVRLDGAFEEAALEATQHRAERLERFRASQMGQARNRKGALIRVPALALRGRPETAIAWKNVAAALRGGAWRTQVLTFTLGLALLATVLSATAARSGDFLVGITLGWGAMLLFLGPLWMRFDLRLDLPRLAVLKTMPLPGWRIVGAEIVAVTVLHSITIWLLMLVPVAFLLYDPARFSDTGVTAPLLVAVAVAVPVFNALMFTIQNGMALLFPAWVRLGADARGFETMGQNLLTTGSTTLIAAVALVFPAGVGLLVLWLAGDWSGWAAVLAAALADVVVLLELWPVWIWLGSVFDETDVGDVAVTA